MKKSILMLLSLFMLGACSLASEDSLFLEEVAGKTITLEGTSYIFSIDGMILYSSELSFEFASTSSSTVANYTTKLGGTSHSITVKIVDNMISVSKIETPLFLKAVSLQTVYIDGAPYKFSTNGQTISYDSKMHSYELTNIVSSTKAKYTDDIDTYIISINSDETISAELSSSTKDDAFLKLLNDDENLTDVDGYSIGNSGKTLYTEDKDHIAVYFEFVSAIKVDDYDDPKEGSATYQVIVARERFIDVTVGVTNSVATIIYGEYDDKEDFLTAAFKEQVKGKTVTINNVTYGFSAFGNTLTKFVDGGDGDIDYTFGGLVADDGKETAYKAKYTNPEDSLTVTIKGESINSIVDTTSSS